ncbi:MAG: hypothetical protein NTU81_01775 [Candidatus Nomurabacteria bacterium]|nr:hypothetical protein [Candidatus Nomurabacteria bacterium]
MEKFNIFNKTEVDNSASKKETENNLSVKLEDKISFVKENNVETFEDWSQKTFEEKMSILVNLDAIPYNFDHFDNNYVENLKNKITEDFNKDNDNASLELDRNYDFFMRLIQYPNYIEKSKILYPGESKSLAEGMENSDFKKFYEYSEHKYPEELLNLKPEVIECLKKESENNNKLIEILSPLDALKNNGIKNLSEWYNKSIDEKRKILQESPVFSGGKYKASLGNKIQTILKVGKDKYNAYLDQCFYSTMSSLSQAFYLENQTINQTLNKEQLYESLYKNYKVKISKEYENKINKLEKEFEDMSHSTHKETEDGHLLKIEESINELNQNISNMEGDEKYKIYLKKYSELSFLREVFKETDNYLSINSKNIIKFRIKVLEKIISQF